MEILVKTKYNVNQWVYVTKKESFFHRGVFVTKDVPDTTSYQIKSIFVILTPSPVVLYRLDGKRDKVAENVTFETFEEVEKFCNEFK